MVAQVADEVHYPDGRVGLASLDEISDSRYANGDLAKLRPLGGACQLIFLPVLVEVRGTWRGQPVAYLANFENRCVARDRSAGVFRFSEPDIG